MYKVIDGTHYILVDRFKKMQDARRFFFKVMGADCDKIAIENPVPMSICDLPDYDQVIEPYEFGDPYKKKTCLWLKGLPKLTKVGEVEPQFLWVSGGSKKKDGTKRGMIGKQTNQKMRSKTFHGIAEAMAEQWGGMRGNDDCALDYSDMRVGKGIAERGSDHGHQTRR